MKKFEAFVSFEVRPTSIARFRMEARLFCVFLRDPLIEHITEESIIEYLAILQRLGYQHNSLVIKTQTISRIFKWAYERGYPILSYKKIPKMRLESRMPRVATKEDVAKILSVIPDNKLVVYPRNHAIIRLLWDTGARVGEICSLNIDDVDLDKMKAIIRTEKTRGTKPFREIYWTEETNDWLKKWIETRKKMRETESALFVGSTNTNYGKRLTNCSIGIILRKYSRLAGIEIINAHSFRHAMGHHLSEKGANNSIISSVLGHSTLSSSFIYTELNNKEREEAYNKFVRDEYLK